jgi:hypothetical protein
MRNVVIVAVAVLLVVGTAVAVKGYFDYQESRYGYPVAYGQRGYGPGGSGGCSASGGSCCGGPGRGGAQQTDLKAIEKAALSYYAGRYGDGAVTVRVKDFGCHQEAYILKNGETVKRLSVNNGSIYEI